ncbi:hypothetical protein AB1Y20_006022 [Prymnesium parvum]|uniref:AB hydrolase-1 domain-containing protein n=1 Tax=Prymnesium parvum TaxID=97485 RepID=A0AB34J3H7_PRYPA
MEGFLESAGLQRLSEQLSGKLSLSDALELLDEGRPKLMEKLKELGVTKPPDKQAFCKAVANGRREIFGTGKPIVVCTYSAGVTPKVGRDIMQPLLNACKQLGLTDQVVLDHHNEPPYDACKTHSEYIMRLRDTVIGQDPERGSRPWILLAHSHGSVAAYSLARLLGPKVRHVCILCRRAPTVELLHDVFGVATCEEIEAMPMREFAQTLGSVYANPTLLAMTRGEDVSKWSASAQETVKIAQSQYMAHAGLCSAVDIAKEIGERGSLSPDALIHAPILVVTTPQETEKGETAAKAAPWAELTSAKCSMEQVDAAHMEVPAHASTIQLVVDALKPYAPEQ